MAALTVQFLGTGDAFGSGARFQACILLRAADSTLLLDCGPSSLIAMRRFGVDPATIDAIVVSHMHGDHFGGIPFFVLDSEYVTKRDRTLTIAGPTGVERRVREATEALFGRPIDRHHTYEIVFRELPERRPAEIAGFTVTPYHVVHGGGIPPFAFRVEYEGRTVAYSGDTEWTETLFDVADGADLFICEANYYEPPGHGHIDYQTLAANRERLDCKRLLLTHMGPDVLARAGELEIEMAHDGMVVEL